MKTPKKVEESWDLSYQVRDIPWHDERPPHELVRVLREGWFNKFGSVPDSGNQNYRKYNAGKPDSGNPFQVGQPSRLSGSPYRKKILDIGCGLGTASLTLANAGFDVLGIDLSHTAIEEARHRAMESGIELKSAQPDSGSHVIARRGATKQSRHYSSFRRAEVIAHVKGKVHFEVRDAFNLKPYYGNFDLAIDLGCLHSFSGNWRSAYLKEIHRVLKPHGLYWVMTFGKKAPNYGPHRYSQKEIRELTSPLFEIVFIRSADWSTLYQRTPSLIQSVSCLMKKS